LDDLLYQRYVRTFTAFEAAIHSGEASQVSSLLGDVVERQGLYGLVSLIAITDASSSRIRRSMKHLTRRLDELTGPAAADSARREAPEPDGGAC
jgi:hypothetical protein